MADQDKPTELGDILPYVKKYVPNASFLAAAFADKDTYAGAGADLDHLIEQWGKTIQDTFESLRVFMVPNRFVTYIQLINLEKTRMYRFRIDHNLPPITVHQRLISKKDYSEFKQVLDVSMIPSMKFLILLKVYDMIATTNIINHATVDVNSDSQENAKNIEDAFTQDDFVWEVSVKSTTQKGLSNKLIRQYIVDSGHARSTVLQNFKSDIAEILTNIEKRPILNSNPLGMTLKEGGKSKMNNKAYERTNRHVMLPGKSKANVVYAKRGHEYVKIKGEFITVRKAIAECTSKAKIRLR